MRYGTKKHEGASDAVVAVRLSVSGRPALAVARPGVAGRLAELHPNGNPSPIGDHRAAEAALQGSECDLLLLETGQKCSPTLLDRATRACIPVVALATEGTSRSELLDFLSGGAVSYAREADFETLPALSGRAREAAEGGLAAAWKHLSDRLRASPLDGEEPGAGEGPRREEWVRAMAEGVQTRVMNDPYVRCHFI